ncbi:hypothetical protein NL676_020061 [Syzygium grande]|nr:hypothetical protein NL676_020061 [Syzygium grande]
MDIQRKRVQLLVFVAGIIALSITAEKCRELMGEEASSQSGKFTLLNCLDMGSGTLACSVKEGVKLYFYNIRAAHVERARHLAMETAIVDALSQGLTAKDAATQAQKEGAKAAKLASRQAKRIIGPIISSGWDFFEAIYYGGTVTEGVLRGSGTLFGAYAGGFLGEQRLGKFGYLVGSHLGSWVGGRIGLMVYDVVNGVQFLLQFVQPQEEEAGINESPVYKSFEGSEESYETPLGKSSDPSEDYDAHESATYSEASENYDAHESTTYSESYEEL